MAELTVVLTMVNSGGGSGITGKKEDNIFQMTKASYHRPRVTAQLAMLLFLFHNIQAA